FLPTAPFRAGETVTVRGRLTLAAGAHAFAYRFTVSRPDTTLFTAGALGERDPNEKQHFHSAPTLLAPLIAVTASSPQTSPGDIFTAPYAGPGPSGPMIFDSTGSLIWFDPLPRGTEATNLQVQQSGGAPVLTWWQGRITLQGFGQGEEMIADSSYRQIGRVHAGNGFNADLHDFHLMGNGTALLTVFDPIECSLSSTGGPPAGAVSDSIMEELDISTGLVRREWHSLDHVSLGDSYSSARSASNHWPFDYFHLNSIDQLPDGHTLISARNTSALYELDTMTGRVLTRIGGRHSDVRLGHGAATAYQHDAEVLADGTISIFDNGALPKVHPQTRGLIVSIDPHKRTDSVLRQLVHPNTPLSSGSQGNLQSLPGGDLFMGWGSEPYFSEFNAAGTLLFDAHMRGSYQSYRSYRFAWTGAPAQPPSVAVAAATKTAPTTVYASWNGDTRTAFWRVLAGPSAQALSAVAGAPRSGFETAIGLPARQPFVAVQALDGTGNVLATSTPVAG
ncbi:MAG TPA: arylsulfotransferase family protein, partial [Solirubrobacteraceae bacterium]